MRLRIALVLALFPATSTLAAEAVTYRGTLGRLPVIVELAEPDAAGNFVGRYAYLAKGSDIPLHGTTAGGGFALYEEAPCTRNLCKNAGDDNVEKAPVGATWKLETESDGARLTGSWKDVKSGKSLPVALERLASRSLPDGYDGFDALDPTNLPIIRDGGLMRPADLPYDFAKMRYPLKEGQSRTLGDARYRMDLDSRTGLDYPVVVTLPGGDVSRVNDYLARQRLEFSFNSFYCLSTAYLGLGWWGSGGEGTPGYEGGALVRLQLLTPRLVGLTESGSYYCGGAHPDNFSTYKLGDIATGEPIAAETLLRGWVARDDSGKVIDPATVADKDTLSFGPSDDLVKFVTDRRNRSDATYEEDCGAEDLLRSNLGVYFTQDEMIFTFRNLPHVIFACTDDLVKIPLAEARPLLTDKGARLLLGP